MSINALIRTNMRIYLEIFMLLCYDREKLDKPVGRNVEITYI